MTFRPDRLQGTDGIRGVVVPDDEESRADPVGAFLQTERLTPSFAELYARAFAEEEASPGGEVIVGWDPRDREGLFTGAVVRGVQLARRKAVVVGTVPTPAVPLVMVRRGANAGIMVTASHNPEGQNGLKAFVGPLATKLYPVDEVRLTRRVYDLGESGEASSEGALTETVDAEVEARDLFLDYSCDPRNSWLSAPAESSENPLADLLLVVDASGGGMAGLALAAFRRLGVREAVEVNGPGAPVNQGGGVVELEQVQWINDRCVSDSGRDLSSHAGAAALLEMARNHREDLLAGSRWAAAAVFDGDGDRFVCLLYDPFRDGLAVLDGDAVGLHMARFLAGSRTEAYRGALYINTVDSDLAAATAASALGFRPALTAVGDKWLLWRAGLSWARASAETGGGSSGELEALEEGGGDARALGEFYRGVGAASAEVSFPPEKFPFAVGSEASGHHVTIGWVDLEDRPAPVFAGNGLKAAINAFAAIRRLAPGKSPEEWIDAVCRPFEAGYHRTCYAFYTERARFAPGTEVWERMDRLLNRVSGEQFGDKYQARGVRISEDPGMLYLALDGPGGVQRAGVFVRNSGTEERTGVTVQGAAEDAPALEAVSEEALKALLLDLKRRSHRYAIAEAELLALLTEGTGPLAGEDAEAAADREVDGERLLRGMERQGLIHREGEFWVATDLGQWYLAQWLWMEGMDGELEDADEGLG